MELEQTDQEQVEALQKWWSENWKSLIGGLVLGLGGILGWQHYGESQNASAADASRQYDTILSEIGRDNLDQAQTSFALLKQEHAGSPYVLQSLLALAELQSSKGDWAGAESNLTEALAAAEDDAMKGLVHLRLARALWAQGKTDAALAELKNDAGAWAPLYSELKGDIAAAAADKATARAAYEAALASDAQYLNRQSLQRKLDAVSEG